MTMNFSVKPVVLALALAGMMSGSVWAASTPSTSSVQGRAPVLSAPSNNATQAVDFSGTYATPGKLSTGDTVVMTYDYTDLDGDADGSHTTVSWSYTPQGGGADVPITATSIPAPNSGGQGTSTITLPIGALGATAIKVTVQEFSATGDPISGTTINIADVSNGGGGAGPNPPVGPVVPGSNVTPGIYLSTDVTFTNNLIGTATNLVVGQTYVFKLWDSAQVAQPAGDLTATVPNYNWRLVGTSATDGVNAPATGFVTSVVGGSFTIPVNSAADGTPLTGSDDGAQGFSLAVDY